MKSRAADTGRFVALPRGEDITEDVINGVVDAHGEGAANKSAVKKEEESCLNLAMTRQVSGNNKSCGEIMTHSSKTFILFIALIIYNKVSA